MSKDLPVLQELQAPIALSGSTGRNRAHASAQISASDDRQAVLAWLARYAATPATLDAYRRETERLLLWCWHQRGLPLSSLAHEDLLLYERFLADPQPAERWVMSGKHPRTSRLWRPFVGPLSASSVRHALTIVNALFTWLVQAGYLAGNPLSLGRRSAAKQPARIERYLSHAHWAAVQETILALPVDTPRRQAHAVRARWLFSLLYVGAMRISEVCSTLMGHFECRRGTDGDRWWLQVTGKGGRVRWLPATRELMEELARYRLANGLPALPHADETHGLVLPVIGDKKGLTRSALHNVVKSVAKATADRLRAGHADEQAMAGHIEQASAHWLRHTAGTHLSEKVDLQVVRDNLGHRNISTTSVYLHTEEARRHDATEKAHRIDWLRPKPAPNH